MPTTRSPYFTINEAAAYYRCDHLTIRRAVRKGELPAVRLGSAKAIRLHRDDLEAWLQPAADKPRQRRAARAE